MKIYSEKLINRLTSIEPDDGDCDCNNGNDFLLHMARLIAGIFSEVGKKKIEAADVKNFYMA